MTPATVKNWLSVPRNLAATLAVGVLLLGGLLYGIGAFTVHEAKPEALKTLVLAAKPVEAPKTGFTAPDGTRVTLADFRGRYVLVNLWASWCAPCVEELPALETLQKAIPKAQFEILAVNAGRGTMADAAAFLKEKGAPGLSLYGDDGIALMRALKAYGLPVSVLIDPQGREIARAVGQAKWSAPEAIAWFKTLAEK